MGSLPRCPRCDSPLSSNAARGRCAACGHDYGPAPRSAFAPDVLPEDDALDDGSAFLRRCQSCGKPAPTQYVSFHQHIGALVMMFHKNVEGNLCRPCIDHHFWQCTGVTAAFGWWGLMSFFITPVCLLMNVVRYAGASSLPARPGRPS